MSPLTTILVDMETVTPSLISTDSAGMLQTPQYSPPTCPYFPPALLYSHDEDDQTLLLTLLFGLSPSFSG
jgi:hypothetical protein